MKADQLKEYIVKIVRNEVRTVIREEIRGYLSEAFAKPPNKLVSESTKTFIDDSMDISEHVESVPTTPKKFVQYTKNPILNQILNETTGGVPQEGSLVSMLGATGRSITESTIPSTAPEPVKKVAAALTRDYSSLLKAVEQKRASKK
jgi:hypothetical protein